MRNYEQKKGQFLKNGHTMLEEDVLNDLKRLAYLENEISEKRLVRNKASLSSEDCKDLIYYGETKDKKIKIGEESRNLDYILFNMFDWARKSARFNTEEAIQIFWERIKILANR